MARIPFAVHSYKLDTLPASAQELINLYAEPTLPGSRSPFVVRSVPGLVEFVNIGISPIHLLAEFENSVYSVSGGFPNLSVHKITAISSALTGTATLIGAFPSVGFPLFSASSATQMVIVNPPLAYVVSGGAVTQITDPDFPDVTSVAYIGGYFVFTVKDSDEYIVSSLLDATAYDALDVASAEAVPDRLRRVIEHNNELWLFCDRSIEIHAQTGAADFPFERQSGGVIDVGTISAASVAIVDQKPFWLGHDLIVYGADGYRHRRVSTYSIEHEIRSLANPSNSFGQAVNYAGHPMYVLTFLETAIPGVGPGVTFVYDVSTDMWHKRASTFTGGGVPDKWNATSAVFFHRNMLVGHQNGRIYRMEQDVATEGTTPLIAIGTLPPIWADTGRGFAHRIELEAEMGASDADLDVTLSWSNDGGFTFNAGIARSMGPPGVRTGRLVWHRMGAYRQRVYRFQFEAGALIRAYGADLRKSETLG